MENNPWEAGSAVNPIKFDSPHIDRGIRRNGVWCYDDELTTNQYERKDNVLYRVSDADDDGTLHPEVVERAYWPIPTKPTMKTIMGHVEICLVLTKRCIGRDFNEGGDSCSSSTNVVGIEDDDIVFQVTKEYVAVKVNYHTRIEELQNETLEDSYKEISAMQLIGNDHPNVMGILEVLNDGPNLNIVMPYCNSGDLFEVLAQRQLDGGRRMPESEVRYWFRQVMTGIQYLHSKGICHRDLSPENIMIDGTNSLIIDMGMCLRMPYTDPNPNSNSDDDGGGGDPVVTTNVTDITQGTQRRLMKPQGICGKSPYMSPEIWLNRVPFDGVASDVWTAGTILFRMVTGATSYKQPYDTQFHWMAKKLPQLIKGWRVPLSDECVHLLQNMIQIDPRNRLSVEEVLNHPWFVEHPDQPPP